MSSGKKNCFLLFIFFANNILAQDANYWQSSYGPGGYFTPGAVISNNKDSGAFFYNPALLAYTQRSAASISGTIYQYDATKMKNAVGSGLDLKYSTGSVIPQMASNTISLKLKKPVTIAYALIHDAIINFSATQRRDDKFQVLQDYYSPGPEFFVGSATLQNVVNTTVAMAGTGIKVAPKLAVGFFAEARVRKQYYAVNVDSRALVNIGTDTAFQPISSTLLSYYNTFTDVGIRFKGGISYDMDENNHLGLLITSPLIHLGGSAILSADEQISDLRVDTSLVLYFLASTRQTGLKTKWKLPLSIGLGYTHDFAGGQIYFATEYFAKVKEYVAVAPRNDYFIRPDTSNNETTSNLLKLVDIHNAVINFAIGYNHQIRNDVTGFISFRTDFSYSNSKYDNSVYSPQFVAYISSWNQYHCQLGANFKKRKFNLRAGLLFTYGFTNNTSQSVNFDNPNEGNLLLGDVGPTKANHFTAGLSLSYIHNF